MDMVRSVLYPPPPSLLLNTLSFINVVALAILGILEVKGTHIVYSKFLEKGAHSWAAMLSGRAGMLLAYTPAFLASLALSSVSAIREVSQVALLTTALCVHFFKRVVEVLFVHKYSGSMRIDITIFMSSSYLMLTVSMIYSQYLSRNLPEPTINLTYFGIGLFLVGIAGNLYHHLLLSKLRGNGEKAYKIPKGGLFDLVVCPHYLFEVIGFFGIALISETIYPLSFAFGSMLYLMGRSLATRKWYLSKFEDFPTGIKAFIPHII